MALVLTKSTYPALVNAGAEYADATSWEVHSGRVLYVSSSTAFEGSYGFYYSSSLCKQRQRLCLTDPGRFTEEELHKGLLEFTVSLYGNFYSASSQIYVGFRFLDESETVIAETEEGTTFLSEDYGTGYWMQLSHPGVAPAAARYVDVIVGSAYSGYLDYITTEAHLYTEGSSSATIPVPEISGTASADNFCAGVVELLLPTVSASYGLGGGSEGSGILPVHTVDATGTASKNDGEITMGDSSWSPWIVVSASTGVWANASLVLPFIETQIESGASATLELPLTAVSASGVVTVVGSASISLPEAQILGYCGHRLEVSLPALTMAAMAKVAVFCQGQTSLPLPLIQAGRAPDLNASGSIFLPPLSATGSAIKAIYGDAAVVLPITATLSSSGGSVVGTGVVSLPALTLAATLTIPPHGDADIMLPALQMGVDSNGSGYYPASSGTVSGRFDEYILRYVRPS